MRIQIDAPPEVLESMLNGILMKVPRDPLPPLYQSGIKYTTDPAEHWQLPAETALRGSGDCEDLALYRAHELRRELGEDARVAVYRSTPNTLHAVVRRANGTLEDPSRALGMGGRIGEALPGMFPPAGAPGAFPGMFPPAGAPGAFPGMFPPAAGGLPIPLPVDPMTAAALAFLTSPTGKSLARKAGRKIKSWWK